MAPTESSLKPHLNALNAALIALAAGRPSADDPADLFEAALSAATGAQPGDPYWAVMSSSQVVPESVRRLRKEAEMSQTALAEAMAALGFPWSRAIVADVERWVDPDDPAPRQPKRLTFEEMIGLAVLFGVPVVELWRVQGTSNVDFEVAGLRSVRPEQVTELIIGRRGVIGEGGPSWAAAASAIDPEVQIERPARRLWRTRRANVKGGQ